MYYNAELALIRAEERIIGALSIESQMVLQLAPDLIEAVIQDVRELWSMSRLVEGARGRKIKKWARNILPSVEIRLAVHAQMREIQVRRQTLEKIKLITRIISWALA